MRKMVNDPGLPFRGTGRTTRMLNAALEKAIAGYTVVVVAADRGHVNGLFHDLLGLTDKLPRTVKFKQDGVTLIGMGTIRIRAIDSDYSWELNNFKGYPVDTKVFVDHYTYERAMRPLR